MVRKALLTVFARLAIAALVPLCQCSFLFDFHRLDNGDADSGDTTDDGGGDDGLALEAAVDAGFVVDASEAGDLETSSDDAGLDATVDSGDTDATPDSGGPDAPVDGGAADTAPDRGTIEGGMEGGSIDAPSDGPSIDAPAEGGGLALGLAAFYPFAESSGTVSADASNNNHSATMQGATFSAGVQNNAATMNGSNQYVSLPSGIMNGFTAFSISMWINLNAVPTHVHIFDFGTGTTAYMFLTPNSGTGTLQFAITTSGGPGEQRMNAPALVGTGVWRHLCVTLSGTTATLYVNGVQSVQNTAMTLNPSALGITTQNWIGRSQFTADPYANGKVDEFRIYNRALTAAEVQYLFAQRQ
jgi:hypothetical protein